MTATFRTNATSEINPSPTALVKAIAPVVCLSRAEIRDAIRTLAVGANATFETKSPADAGGFTSLFVERTA